MKDVVKMLQEMEQVAPEVKVALITLCDATDKQTVQSLIVDVNESLNHTSIANAISALSFVLGLVLSNDKSLTDHERKITLYAFLQLTKAAIRTIEKDE